MSKTLIKVTGIAVVVALSVGPANAQFGIPQIVHDPLNEIQLLYENGTLAQQVLESIYLFNLATQEALALKNKQYMLAAGVVSNFIAHPVLGHGNWNVGLTTSIGAAGAGSIWHEMITSTVLLQPYLTIQNRVMIADAFGASMIDTLGSCNAAMVQTDGAIYSLEGSALSSGLLENTNDTLNGQQSVGITQQLRIAECQTNLQTQIGQMQLLNALRNRDYENSQSAIYQKIDMVTDSGGPVDIGGLNTAPFN